MNTTIAWGLLGWSNKRDGLEVYRYDEKIIPRHGSEWGDLLALDPDIADKEGAPLLVVVFPRRATKDDLIRATAAVQQALAAAGSAGNTEEQA